MVIQSLKWGLIYILYMRIPSMGWMTIESHTRFKSWHSDKIVEIPAANAVSSQLSLSNDVTLHESAEKRVWTGGRLQQIAGWSWKVQFVFNIDNIAIQGERPICNKNQLQLKLVVSWFCGVNNSSIGTRIVELGWSGSDSVKIQIEINWNPTDLGLPFTIAKLVYDFNNYGLW